MKYRSRATVEAIQWTGENFDEVCSWVFTSRAPVELTMNLTTGFLCVSERLNARPNVETPSKLVDKGSWLLFGQLSGFAIVGDSKFRNSYAFIPEPTP